MQATSPIDDEIFREATAAAGPPRQDMRIQLWKRFEIRNITVSHVDLAREIASRYGHSNYDVLILSTAKHAACSIVYSEAMRDG